jgi:transcriptional regulator with XRE-family HTH domain
MSNIFGEYLKRQIAARRKSEGRVWTQNELGRRAGISGGHTSMIINGLIEPDAATLKKIARALKVSDEEVFEAAGVLPAPEGELSGDVLALAREIDAVPEAARGRVIAATREMLAAIDAALGERITEGYSVLDEQEYLAAIIRQFRDADPEEYARFVAALTGGDKTTNGPDTSGDAGPKTESNALNNHASGGR